MTGGADLKVRRFERMDLIADATLTVAPEHGDQVRFSTSAPGGRSAKELAVTVMDIGSGGVGMRTSTPLPRQLQGVIRIAEPIGNSDKPSTRERIILKAPVRVCRCEAIPGLDQFLVGAAFIGDDAAIQRLLESFFRDVRETLQVTATVVKSEAGDA